MIDGKLSLEGIQTYEDNQARHKFTREDSILEVSNHVNGQSGQPSTTLTVSPARACET
jgi:hypothetical protein